jgi:hypothetical protein
MFSFSVRIMHPLLAIRVAVNPAPERPIGAGPRESRPSLPALAVAEIADSPSGGVRGNTVVVVSHRVSCADPLFFEKMDLGIGQAAPRPVLPHDDEVARCRAGC